MSSATRVSVVVVTHGHAGEIDACLDAALAQDPGDLRLDLVVVDNASPDATAERIAARDGDVRLLAQPRNLGYAAATNAAVAAGEGDWVLLLNPDCVMDPGCVAALHAHLSAEPQVAVAAALLRDPDGTPQLFARRRDDLRTALWAYVGAGRRFDERWRGGRGAARRRYADAWAGGAPTAPLAVDSPAAACVLLRRADLGPRPLDERLPLFFNDSDLYARLRAGGRRLEVVPAATAAHGYSTSIRRAGRAEPVRLRAEWVVSLRRYAAKHWSRPARAALTALLLADVALAAAERARGRRDDENEAFLRGTLGGLGLPGGAPPLLTRKAPGS